MDMEAGWDLVLYICLTICVLCVTVIAITGTYEVVHTAIVHP